VLGSLAWLPAQAPLRRHAPSALRLPGADLRRPDRATRYTRAYAGADPLGGDVAGDWLEVRDRVKDVLAENPVRPTRRLTTLDYLYPGERAVLEEGFATPRQSPPALDSPLAGAARAGGASRPGGAGQRLVVGGLGRGRPRPWPCPRHSGRRLARSARHPDPGWLAPGRLSAR
jgi:hypothetical protein